MLLRKINIFLFLSVLFFLVGCSEKTEEQSTEEQKTDKKIPKVNVEVYSIKEQKTPLWVEFSGKTEAYKDVSVVARVKGNLENRFFEPGDYVKKGDKLFKIEDSEYIAILNKYKANKKKNQASLKLAINSHDRYKPLVEKELATKEKLDQLVAEKEQIEALIKADESTIKQAKLNLDYTLVKATIDGTIGMNLVDIGNMVGPNTENTKLANIVKSNPLYINFSPSGDDSALIAKYKSELKPKIVAHVPSRDSIDERTYKGYVDFIDNKTNESTGTVSMRAIINNEKQTLLPGTFVEIKLFLSDQIPIVALSPKNVMENQLGSYVYIVNEENKLEIRQVKILYAFQGVLVIKRDSLKDGENVVVSPLSKLREGIEVVFKHVDNPTLKQGK
ncbi:MAG: efflux RND transporter periplasmic adaptor subunit [Sulfurospirillum sp.]|nr:efflux RND transporter periplasmic adaptor subunit [Sulfurospirillum sp.]